MALESGRTSVPGEVPNNHQRGLADRKSDAGTDGPTVRDTGKRELGGKHSSVTCYNYVLDKDESQEPGRASLFL